MQFRILFFLHLDEPQRKIMEDIAKGYEQAGHVVDVLDIKPYERAMQFASAEDAKQSVDNLWGATVFQFIRNNGINLCISAGAKAVESLQSLEGNNFFEGLSVPYLMHWIEPPYCDEKVVDEFSSQFLNGTYCYHCIGSEATAVEMQNVFDFQNIIPLQPAVSPTRFQSQAETEKRYDVVALTDDEPYEPTSTMLEELEGEAPDIGRIRREEAERIQEQVTEIVQDALGENAEVFAEEMLQTQIRDRNTPVLDRLRNATEKYPDWRNEILNFLEDRKAYATFVNTLRSIENWQRKFMISWLGKHVSVMAAGNLEGWPESFTMTDQEVAYENLANIYGQGHFALNMNKWTSDQGVGGTPFEIALSGACLLQEYCQGFYNLFDDNEAIVFDSPVDCLDKVQGMLKAPEKIRETADAARNITLAKHCWEHRASRLTEIIGNKVG